MICSMRLRKRSDEKMRTEHTARIFSLQFTGYSVQLLWWLIRVFLTVNGSTSTIKTVREADTSTVNCNLYTVNCFKSVAAGDTITVNCNLYTVN